MMGIERPFGLEFPLDLLASPITGSREWLHPGERASMANATGQRVAEFATGRAIARRLLERFGHGAEPIPVDEDRCPVWPEGIVGSIAHCEDLCVVGVISAARAWGAGVDVEPAHSLERALWPIILTKRERAWLETRPAAERGVLARVLFSARESFYKCRFPRTRRFIDFHDVAIDLEGDRFYVKPANTETGKEIASEPPYEGRWTIRDRWILTGVVRLHAA